MSYILEALKKLELQKSKKRTSTPLKEIILTETPSEPMWSKKSVLASILAVIFVLGLSAGLFLSRGIHEGRDSQQFSLQKSKITKPISQQTKIDTKSHEVPAVSQETPQEETKDKIASREEEPSKTITYGYKGKIEVEIPPPF